MIAPYVHLKEPINSIEELQNATNIYYEKQSIIHNWVRVEKKVIILEIDSIIKANKKDKVKQLVKITKGNEFQKVYACDDELKAFAKILEISEQEREIGKIPILEKITSVAHAYEIYTKTIFGLRRLEFGLPRESQKEFLQMIIDCQFSSMYMIRVWQTNAFHNKNNVLKNLLILLYSNGLRDMGEEMFVMMKQCEK